MMICTGFWGFGEQYVTEPRASKKQLNVLLVTLNERSEINTLLFRKANILRVFTFTNETGKQTLRFCSKHVETV
jgi:hypothetical protein